MGRLEVNRVGEAESQGRRSDVMSERGIEMVCQSHGIGWREKEIKRSQWFSENRVDIRVQFHFSQGRGILGTRE